MIKRSLQLRKFLQKKMTLWLLTHKSDSSEKKIAHRKKKYVFEEVYFELGELKCSTYYLPYIEYWKTTRTLKNLRLLTGNSGTRNP